LPEDERPQREKEIVDRVRRHFEKEGYKIISQYELEGGKVDLLAYKWDNPGYGIRYYGIECKPKITHSKLLHILRDQLSKYRDTLPSICLAAYYQPDNFEAYKKFCEAQSVWLLGVDSSGNVQRGNEPIFTQKNTSVNIAEERLKSKLAAFFAFQEIFQKTKAHSDWISIEEDIQYNCTVDDQTLILGVNVENLEKIKGWKEIIRKVLRNNGKDLSLNITKEKYVGRRRWRDLIVKHPLYTLKKSQQLENLVRKSIDEGYSIHIGISTQLWRTNELYGKIESEEIMDRAKKRLSHVYDLFTRSSA
jgi:hypothetical protein